MFEIPKECDIELYEQICRKSKSLPHDELYHSLMNWKGQHPEIREVLAKRKDTYEVCYINSLTGKSERKTFTVMNGGDPYRLARQFYGRVLNIAEVAELRHLPNPYMFGNERMGKLILSYEKEQ